MTPVVGEGPEIGDDWADPQPSLGRALFQQPELADASSIVAFARSILSGVPASTRRRLLKDLDQLLDAFAATIRRTRERVVSGACLCHVWQPAHGGPSGLACDIDQFGCPEMLCYPPFQAFLRGLSRDYERAFLKAVSHIAVRDFENGDYRSVLAARGMFDLWCARLILRDERTHKKRRQGGQKRGREFTDRAGRARSRVLKHADNLRSAGVPKREWVPTIDAGLDRGSDAPYPRSRTIRRILKKARYLP